MTTNFTICSYVHINLQGLTHSHVYRSNYTYTYVYEYTYTPMYIYRNVNISILACTQLNKIVLYIYPPMHGYYIKPHIYPHTVVKC